MLHFNPEYLSEWNWEVNNKISWICSECNLEWKASPKDRSEGVADCPYCSGKKAIPGKTSFKAQNPSLMNEWKNVNNLFIDADSILENYSQNVWWICPITKRQNNG